MSSIDVRPANLRDICFIAANMRDQDRREISAVIWFDSTAQLGAACLSASGQDAFIAYLDDKPVAAIGVSPVFDGLGAGWAFGTDRMKRVVPALTRFCRDTWIADLERRYRRVEVRSISDHDISHGWLQAIGYRFEGIAKGYGRRGEDFHTFGYVRR